MANKQEEGKTQEERNGLVHSGRLFCHMRESRRVDLNDMAQLCQVDYHRLRGFEQGSKQLQIADKYISALRYKVQMPITLKEADVVKGLYKAGLKKERTEQRHALSCVSFSDILQNERNEQIYRMVEALRQSREPAFIMDPTLSVHAMNELLLRLFNIDLNNPEHQKHLRRWEFWNNLSCKFYLDSLFRQAHDDPDTYFEHVIRFLFQHPFTRPYWFTPQMRVLIERVKGLDSTVFPRVWSQTTAFIALPNKEVVKRRLWHVLPSGEKILIGAEADLSKQYIVDYGDGVCVPFILGIWKPEDTGPIGHVSSNVFKELERHWRRKVSFAAEYDTEGDFHVNTWPEVKKMITDEEKKTLLPDHAEHHSIVV